MNISIYVYTENNEKTGLGESTPRTLRTVMDDSDLEQLSLPEQAATWLTRLAQFNANRDIRKAFRAWLLRSPNHVKEFLLATVVQAAIDDLAVWREMLGRRN